MVFGLRSLSATFDTVALENQLVDLDQQEAKLKEEMRLRPVTIREDRARVQQTLDAARDFAEPFQTLSGVLLVFVESVGPSLWTGTGLGPMVQGLQRALPPQSPERETEPAQEHAPVPPGGSREEPSPSHSTMDPGDLDSPVGMEVSASENPSTSGNTADAVPPTEPGIPRELSNPPGEGVESIDSNPGTKV